MYVLSLQLLATATLILTDGTIQTRYLKVISGNIKIILSHCEGRSKCCALVDITQDETNCHSNCRENT